MRGGGGGGGLDRPFSLQSFLLFLPKIRGRGPAPPGPSPRSATDKIMATMEYAAEDENFIGFEGTE